MGYLVINRRIGERLKIGPIEILVVDFDRGYVELAIDAPREFSIDRPKTKVEEQYGHSNENYGQYRRRKSLPE